MPVKPQSPIALPPMRPIRFTRLLFIFGEHHLTTSAVSASVTRRPSTNSDFSHFIESLRYLRPPPCTSTTYTDKRQQHDIAHHRLFELLALHCASAVFNDRYLVVIPLYIRKRAYEHLRALGICDIHDFPLLSINPPPAPRAYIKSCIPRLFLHNRKSDRSPRRRRRPPRLSSRYRL